MDNSIINALEDLKLPHPHSQDMEEDLKLPSILGDWINYSNLVSGITFELKALCSEVDENVNPIKVPSDDLHSFKMELSSLLKELACPYSTVMDPSLNDRFESPESRKIVLNFLLSELQAARMLFLSKASEESKSMNVDLAESTTAKILKDICQELDLGKPPDTITAEKMWSGIIPKVKARVSSGPPLDPLFTGVLSTSQWTTLENYFKELQSDYTMRREMLLKRLDVTVQSFHWSDRLKGAKNEQLSQEFNKLRPKMKATPSVFLADVLAARSDLPIVEKTSSTSVRKNTRSAVNKVVIGKVPDRGGRPNEVVPPPPEMPSWQQRQAAPSGSSGWIQNPNQRGGQNPSQRGGRVQGGWSGPGGGRGRGGHQQPSHGGHGDYQQPQQGGYDNQRRGGGDQGYNQHDNRNDFKQDNYYQDQDRGNNRGGQRNYRGGGHCQDEGRGGRGRRY